MTDDARCLQSRYSKGYSKHNAETSGVAIKILNKDYRHAHEAVHDISGGVGTLMARDYKDAKRIAIPVLTPDRADKRQNGRRFKEDGEPMFTLTGQDRHGVGVELLGCTDPQGRKLKKVAPRDHVPTPRSQAHGNEPNVVFSVNVKDDKHGDFRSDIGTINRVCGLVRKVSVLHSNSQADSKRMFQASRLVR